MSEFIPYWVYFLIAVAGYLLYVLLCLPVLIVAKLIQRPVRLTRQVEVVMIAAMRALFFAPVPIFRFERELALLPYPFAMIEYIQGDGAQPTTFWMTVPPLIVSITSILVSQLRSGLQHMEKAR